ncbi:MULTISPECIES: 50S ribosomal protein L11 methyltransferase [Gammaproteobacteria]|uniref:50S ribosomal protein L11 methyltransferase n=1 Tax=Gammaproteobacteria TaxID=1236 RepID=UPI000DCF7F4C|nr:MULTISPECIES: 50S ribosomal protein L11 methyltransferase [Gammaproteobacteria]RTE85693.1 50S ribosomal protein L11 methyltransferase [Aliidiomarina sp. B3213]TCZ90306.1 50S ribosomal protein L11 methyltransferase [Lysobacter sp. N42]
MAWIQLTLTTDEAHARQLGDILMANQAQAVTYRDAKDAPIFEPGPGEVQLWSQTLVTGLYPAEVKLQPILSNLAKVSFLAQPLQYKTDPLEDKDWEREWMDNFKPICFGDKFWVVPSWHEPPKPEQPFILLDPGMAFGTGTHPTTSLCLTWLTEQNLEGKTIVDFGCGSGILGIAALKLGAARCIGTDIDQQALIATKDNAKRNGVGDKFEVYLPQNAPDIKADIVIANILAGPLQELSGVIQGYLKPDSPIAMSGILHRQAEDVMNAYSEGVTFAEARFEGDWSLIHGIAVNP